MKIQNSPSPSVYSRPGVNSTTKGGATKSVSTDSSGAKRAGGTTDAASVSLSPEARALAANGNVNEAKVSAIKAQVDAGEYEVDAFRGGIGVIEAGLIAGFTAAGVPDQPAIAATFTARLFTAYLPPIWGWASIEWMRRHDYV